MSLISHSAFRQALANRPLAAIGREMGIAQPTMSLLAARIAAGRSIHVPTAERLAKALGTTVAALTRTPEDAALVARVQHLELALKLARKTIADLLASSGSRSEPEPPATALAPVAPPRPASLATPPAPKPRRRRAMPDFIHVDDPRFPAWAERHGLSPEAARQWVLGDQASPSPEGGDPPM